MFVSFFIDLGMSVDIVYHALLIIFLISLSSCETLFFDESIMDLHDLTYRKTCFVHHILYLLDTIVPQMFDEFGD